MPAKTVARVVTPVRVVPVGTVVAAAPRPVVPMALPGSGVTGVAAARVLMGSMAPPRTLMALPVVRVVPVVTAARVV